MNIISLCTIGETVSTAAAGKNGIFTSCFKPEKIRHSESLLPFIENSIKFAGFTPKETDLILCPQGPGSFTGLRVAYACAKAVQLTSGAVFKAVPTLTAIAAPYENTNAQVIAAIDAKRNRFYASVFKDGKPLFDSLDISAAEILGKVTGNSPIIITGFGMEKFKKDAEPLVNIHKPLFIDASENLADIILRYAENHTSITVEDYQGPVYVRKTDAEGAN